MDGIAAVYLLRMAHDYFKVPNKQADLIREQGGIIIEKVKQAHPNKRAGWNFADRKLNEQDLINEQGGKF